MRCLLSGLVPVVLALAAACQTVNPASDTKGVFSDAATAAQDEVCNLAQMVLAPLEDDTALAAGVYLLKLGVPQGTDAKNVCSCIFVAQGPDGGRTAQGDNLCLGKETLINLAPGKAHAFLLDTRKVVKVTVTRAADPNHPGEYIGTVTARAKFGCVGLGDNKQPRIATYSSYNGARYGCTLGGTPFVETAMP